MKICSIASGSKGNCILVSSKNTNILIDLGISSSMLDARLKSVNFSGKIDGLLITHSHTDHIKGINGFTKKSDAILYASRSEWPTLGALLEVEPQRCRSFEKVFCVKDFDVLPFETPHDVRNYGYTLDCDGERVSVVTDLGAMTDGIFSAICGSRAVLIESNYDQNMLLSGKYPYSLKMRILGEYGHLSNYDCGQTCVRLARAGVKKLILGHLSENNNLPELAYESAAKALSENGIYPGRDVELYVARQDCPTQWIEV